MLEIRNYFYKKEDPHKGHIRYAKADASLVTIQFDDQEEPITFLTVTGARRTNLERELAESGARL